MVQLPGGATGAAKHTFDHSSDGEEIWNIVFFILINLINHLYIFFFFFCFAQPLLLCAFWSWICLLQGGECCDSLLVSDVCAKQPCWEGHTEEGQREPGERHEVVRRVKQGGCGLLQWIYLPPHLLVCQRWEQERSSGFFTLSVFVRYKLNVEGKNVRNSYVHCLFVFLSLISLLFSASYRNRLQSDRAFESFICIKFYFHVLNHDFLF